MQEADVNIVYEWERLIVLITVLRNMFGEQSDLNITKENMR